MKAGLIILVLVLLALIGFGGYKAMNAQKMTPTPTPVAMKTTTTNPSPTAMAMDMNNSVYKVASQKNVGEVMADPKGMTLYTYDKDTKGVSNCSGQCLVNWPAYKATSATGTFPENITVIKRSDGTLQYAWKEMPLYYFIGDKAVGDANGDMVGNVWHVIKDMK